MTRTLSLAIVVLIIGCAQPASQDPRHSTDAKASSPGPSSSFDTATVSRRINELYAATCESCTYSLQDSILLTIIAWPSKNYQEAQSYISDFTASIGEWGFDYNIPEGMRFAYRVYPQGDTAKFIDLEYAYSELKSLMDSISRRKGKTMQARANRLLSGAPNYTHDFGVQYGASNIVTLVVRPEWEREAKKHLRSFTSFFQLLPRYVYKGTQQQFIEIRVENKQGKNVRI